MGEVKIDEFRVTKQVESQVQHILRDYEGQALEDKIIDLALEWYRKGVIDGARIVKESNK